MERTICDEIKILDNVLMRKFVNELNHDNILVTPIQASIICFLIKNENIDIYQKDIEKLISVRRSTVSGILQVMEKNNLIKRSVVGSDLRKRKIYLTDDAITKYEKIKSKILNLENHLKNGLKEDELNIFFSVIDKLKENIGRMREC